MSSSSPRHARVCVAQVGAPHGVRGAVRLKSFTADPCAVADYSPLESEDGARQFRIKQWRWAKGGAIAVIEGVSDRDQALALRNLRLYVPRARLPSPEPDEFYHADLIGLDAYDVAGNAIGAVVAVQNFGAGDLIELQPAVGGATVLLPFTKAAVPQIDLAAGRITVDPPLGALEPSGAAEKKARCAGSLP